MLTDTRLSPYARLRPPAPGSVRLGEGLIKDCFDLCADVVIPHVLSIFDDKDSFFHEVENFRIAAGLSQGEFRGNPFGDGDFYKLLEGLAYVYGTRGDAQVGRQIDEYVRLIALAQQPDGYLSTKQIIGERQGGQARRHGDINDFEEYNFGHLFTCACAVKRETGSSALLTVAEKAADYLLRRYEKILAAGQAQTAVCPSHYMGLAELYRETREPRFLAAASMALRIRDLVQNGSDDNQDRLPLREHREIAGHAVRATYLYAGAADLYMETGDETLLPALNACFDNMASQKLYITGGCGALYSGTSPFGDIIHSQQVHQAFGYAYQLPNITAYNETCAALGNIFWAYRMFAISPQARYFDLIERTVYNLALAAVSLDGKRYFYENVLRRTRTADYELIWPLYRSDSFECFCCPTNLARFLPQLKEYAYMTGEDTVYTGLYMACETRFALPCGAAFTLAQQTEYPWQGSVCITVREWNGIPFTLMLRIPHWLQSGSVCGEAGVRPLTVRDACSYAQVPITREGEMALTLDMPARLTIGHAKVEETVGQACVERGPLVYCLETPDTDTETLDDLHLPSDASFTPEEYPLCGRNVIALGTQALVPVRPGYDRDALYQPLSITGFTQIPARFIPYFAWDNRGFGEMRVWLPLIYRLPS
jgi:uncharacterized protein